MQRYMDARQQSLRFVTKLNPTLFLNAPNGYDISTAHRVLYCQIYYHASDHDVCVTCVISTCTCFGEAGGVSGFGWQLVSTVAGSFPPATV